MSDIPLGEVTAAPEIEPFAVQVPDQRSIPLYARRADHPLKPPRSGRAGPGRHGRDGRGWRGVVEAGERFGGLHLAVNNAGVSGIVAPTGEYDLDAWRRIIDINLNGVFYSLRYELPAIVASGGGAVVTMTSVLGTNGFPGAPVSAAAKHAVVGLTKTAALDYAEAGVRVDAVGPAFSDHRLAMPSDWSSPCPRTT
jgi:hypothetical protein